MSPFESLKFLQKGFVAGLEMKTWDHLPLRLAAAVSAREWKAQSPEAAATLSLPRVATFH